MNNGYHHPNIVKVYDSGSFKAEGDINEQGIKCMSVIDEGNTTMHTTEVEVSP